MSLLTITADFMGKSEAKVAVTVDTFTMLEGSNLAQYITIQVLSLLLALLMAIDAILKIRAKVQER